ncbi:MAG TPA: corrinoid protein [Anaerolineales bacterium]|jgi:5-methyltetrahydrofolate--homocysteine methyltransferase|nr:corrinoid protein [Anaerolineales bacterium]
MAQYLEALSKSVIEGDMTGVTAGVQAALDTGIEAGEILQAGLIPAMGEVGRLFEGGEYYVPEMLVAARAMKAGLEIIRPLLVQSEIKPAGKVVVGTVKGDLHDIGKNLVAMMLEGAGFEIQDLGTDVGPDEFVAALKEDSVDLVGLSALLTTTMPMMKSTIRAITEAGLRDQVKIIVGGAPVTPGYAEEIGADGYAPDASRAVSLARQLIG